MLLAYTCVNSPGPKVLEAKIPYCVNGWFSPAKKLEVADRNAPRQLPICWVPLDPPPLNQISSPGVLAPERKLQAVRFSTLTPDALNTIRPFRPVGAPPGPSGPRSWSTVAELHPDAPGLVPSSRTPLRSMPRMWMPGVVTSTAAPAVSSPTAPGGTRLPVSW